MTEVKLSSPADVTFSARPLPYDDAGQVTVTRSRASKRSLCYPQSITKLCDRMGV